MILVITNFAQLRMLIQSQTFHFIIIIIINAPQLVAVTTFNSLRSLPFGVTI